MALYVFLIPLWVDITAVDIDLICPNSVDYTGHNPRLKPVEFPD
jgi:hypothetical protein